MRHSDSEPTMLAQAAFHDGPNSCLRPAYDTSPYGYAFLAGLWARENRIVVGEVHLSRGHTVILNRRYRLNFAADTDNPKVTPCN